MEGQLLYVVYWNGRPISRFYEHKGHANRFARKYGDEAHVKTFKLSEIKEDSTHA